MNQSVRRCYKRFRDGSLRALITVTDPFQAEQEVHLVQNWLEPAHLTILTNSNQYHSLLDFHTITHQKVCMKLFDVSTLKVGV